MRVHERPANSRVRALLAASAVVMAAALASIAPASASSSDAGLAPCNSPSHNVNGDGYGILTGAHALRSGPSSGCDPNAHGLLSSGTKVWLWCWRNNSAGNKWWWARQSGHSTSGWIYDGNMRKVVDTDDNGDGVIATRPC